jgi:hypothetical protein
VRFANRCIDADSVSLFSDLCDLSDFEFGNTKGGMFIDSAAGRRERLVGKVLRGRLEAGGGQLLCAGGVDHRNSGRAFENRMYQIGFLMAFEKMNLYRLLHRLA